MFHALLKVDCQLCNVLVASFFVEKNLEKSNRWILMRPPGRMRLPLWNHSTCKK